MKPAPFEYHAPETIDEVTGLLAEHGDEAKVLAGGQSLVPMLALRLTRFEHLVDVNRVAALAGFARENGTLVVRACTRQRVMERDPAIAAAVPLLARATPLIGHFQIRNRGTVGGSLAHADPASEYPAVAVALGAELELASPGGARRRLAADDFFVGTWTTAAEPDELLVAARFPVWPARSGFAIEEVARRHGDFALAGVACAITDGRAGIALFGVGSTPVRVRAAEEAWLAGAPAAEVAESAVRDLDPPADVHASGSTRTRIARHLVERAVTRAQEGQRVAG
ncbi:MAG: cutM 2 [Actinomycetia bacterium]|nr:cutM 2 [Actinomycetes bacterium]